MGCSPLYEASFERYINIFEFFMSLGPVFTEDFSNGWELGCFCKDMGLFEAVFKPLDNGGRSFLVIPILGI